MTTDKAQSEILETKKTDVYLLDPRNIKIIDDFNVREDYGDMKWLIEDIRANNVKVPVRVHKKFGSDGIYILTDGHRRHQAAMVLVNEGAEIRIPAICEPRGYSDESRLVDMFTLAEGNKQLNAIEQAKVVGRLISYGLEVKDIAEKIHKSQAYISNLNQLNQAPTKIKKFITSKNISATLTVQILRDTKDYDKAIELIEDLMNDGAEKNNGSEKVTTLPDNHLNEEIAEKEIIKSDKKITKKTIDKKQGKVNSVSHLRKFMKYYDKLAQKDIVDIPKDKQEIFSTLRAIYEGLMTFDSLKEMFDLAEEPVTEQN